MTATVATVTKKFVQVGDLQLMRGMEVTVEPDKGSTLAVTYNDHTVRNVQRQWFDDLVVYRRAVDLGLEAK